MIGVCQIGLHLFQVAYHQYIPCKGALQFYIAKIHGTRTWRQTQEKYQGIPHKTVWDSIQPCMLGAVSEVDNLPHEDSNMDTTNTSSSQPKTTR